MDMLLRNVTIADLAEMLERHKRRSPAPYLKDTAIIRQARRRARQSGLWDRLDGLNTAGDIPVIRRSDWRQYRRTGDRDIGQGKIFFRRNALSQAALALWLNHPAASVDYLQDLLWAVCEETDWRLPAHERERAPIDLVCAERGATLAEILFTVGDRLEDEVKRRVRDEIERRIFRRYWDWTNLDFWKTKENNWNHVCNGSIIRTALYLVEDAWTLAHMIHGLIQNMTYGLDAFADDGGCREGPGYWGYGFGHYLYAAYALYLRTGHELNIMTDEKIPKICRYPLASAIEGPFRATFADSGHGRLPATLALLVNKFHDIPELFELCSAREDGALNLADMHDLCLYQGQKATGAPDQRDSVLPSLGQVKLRGKPGKGQITFMALAGNNGVPHNHNDIGTFIVYRNGRLLLTDPGGPVYTRKTFSPERYEILFCNSLGHSVPIINGRQQSDGSRYYGTLKVRNLNGSGVKTAVIQMARAYPRGTVGKLTRQFDLDPRANTLCLTDTYVFARPPKAIEEGFVTYEPARVTARGRAVRIGPARDGLWLSADDTPGRFTIRPMTKASREGHNPGVLKRIVFTPANLEKTMILRFRMDPGPRS